MHTLVASSTLVSYSANRTSDGSTISPSRMVFQSRPWNLGSPALVGGLLIRSWKACCESDGCREARGEPGPPRMCSAKLERCACGFGLDPMAIFGGGERPRDAVELLSDCRGEGTWPSFLLGVSKESAIAERVMLCGVAGWNACCLQRMRLQSKLAITVLIKAVCIDVSKERSAKQNASCLCAL